MYTPCGCMAPTLPPPPKPILTHRTMPPQVLLQLVQPYTRVAIPFLAGRLNIGAPDVEALLVALILDGRIGGHIDQVGGRVGGLAGWVEGWVAGWAGNGFLGRRLSGGATHGGQDRAMHAALTALMTMHPPAPPLLPPPQVNQLLEVGIKGGASGGGAQMYAALDKWAGQLRTIHTTVLNKMS